MLFEHLLALTYTPNGIRRCLYKIAYIYRWLGQNTSESGVNSFLTHCLNNPLYMKYMLPVTMQNDEINKNTIVFQTLGAVQM